MELTFFNNDCVSCLNITRYSIKNKESFILYKGPNFVTESVTLVADATTRTKTEILSN